MDCADKSSLCNDGNLILPFTGKSTKLCFHIMISFFHFLSNERSLFSVFSRFFGEECVDVLGIVCYHPFNFIPDDEGKNLFREVSESRRPLRAGTEGVKQSHSGAVPVNSFRQ